MLTHEPYKTTDFKISIWKFSATVRTFRSKTKEDKIMLSKSGVRIMISRVISISSV